MHTYTPCGSYNTDPKSAKAKLFFLPARISAQNTHCSLPIVSHHRPPNVVVIMGYLWDNVKARCYQDNGVLYTEDNRH